MLKLVHVKQDFAIYWADNYDFIPIRRVIVFINKLILIGSDANLFQG